MCRRRVLINLEEMTMYIKQAIALSDSEIARKAPSILAEAASARCSSRYTYIPTIEVVRGMRKEGWEPVVVQESRTRDEAREGHQKHMVRFRHQDQMLITPEKHASVPEIVLTNSHDGSSSYQLHAGLWRWVCCNGMVVADGTCAEIKVPHKGDVVGRVIEGAYEIVKDLPKVLDSVAEMQALPLLQAEQREFAKAALLLRWEDPERIGIKPEQVLCPRRREDTGDDLWSVYQRVQESLTKGGNHVNTQDSQGRWRGRRTREVKGINQSVKLNQALWSLAEGMRALKAI